MADSKTELSPTTSKKVFEEINERPVDDIQLELFYKPHTITLRECLTIIESNPLLHLFARKSFFPFAVLLCIFGLTYTAFVRDSTLDHQSNLFAGKLYKIMSVPTSFSSFLICYRPLWGFCLFYDSQCASLPQWTLHSTSSYFVAHGLWLQRYVSFDYSISYPFGLHSHSFYHHLV